MKKTKRKKDGGVVGLGCGSTIRQSMPSLLGRHAPGQTLPEERRPPKEDKSFGIQEEDLVKCFYPLS